MDQFAKVYTPAVVVIAALDNLMKGASGMGVQAIRIFEQVGITAATGASGTVRQAVTDYLHGALAGASPCADSVQHHQA